MIERDRYVPPDETKSQTKKEPPFKIDFRFLLFKLFFPHLQKRGKREYITALILRSSVYLAISFGLSILFGTLMFFMDDLFMISTLTWSPDQILVLPFVFIFLVEFLTAETLVTIFILTIVLPFFIAGITTSYIWKNEARDLVLISSVITFALFILLHLSQELLFTSFGNVRAAILSNFIYYGYVMIFAFSFLIFSALGGYVGVQTGKLIIKIRAVKKGAKVSFSPLILPEMPLSVKTIFDLELPSLEEEEQFSKLSLVYLNQKVERVLRTSRSKTCTYFEGGECAYLGYVTASHKYQICVREFWPVCKVYAFLKQSSKIMEEVNREEKNVRKS